MFFLNSPRHQGLLEAHPRLTDLFSGFVASASAGCICYGYPSGSFCLLRCAAEMLLSGEVCCWMRKVMARPRSSSMRLQMFGMNLLLRAKWQGFYRSLQEQGTNAGL